MMDGSEEAAPTPVSDAAPTGEREEASSPASGAALTSGAGAAAPTSGEVDPAPTSSKPTIEEPPEEQETGRKSVLASGISVAASWGASAVRSMYTTKVDTPTTDDKVEKGDSGPDATWTLVDAATGEEQRRVTKREERHLRNHPSSFHPIPNHPSTYPPTHPAHTMLHPSSTYCATYHAQAFDVLCEWEASRCADFKAAASQHARLFTMLQKQSVLGKEEQAPPFRQMPHGRGMVATPSVALGRLVVGKPTYSPSDSVCQYTGRMPQLPFAARCGRRAVRAGDKQAEARRTAGKIPPSIPSRPVPALPTRSRPTPHHPS